MELSNDVKRVKEMCERRKSFVALQIADEDNPDERLAYIYELEAYNKIIEIIEIMEIIERMWKEKGLIN